MLQNVISEIKVLRGFVGWFLLIMEQLHSKGPFHSAMLWNSYFHFIIFTLIAEEYKSIYKSIQVKNHNKSKFPHIRLIPVIMVFKFYQPVLRSE